MGVVSLPGSGCCWLPGHCWEEAQRAAPTVSLWRVPARVLSLFQGCSGLLKLLVYSDPVYFALLLHSAPHGESILALLFLYEQWWLDVYLQQLHNHTTQCNTTTAIERDAWNSLTVMQNVRDSDDKSWVPGPRDWNLILTPLSSTDGELGSVSILFGDLEVWADGTAVPAGWMSPVSSLTQWIAFFAGPDVGMISGLTEWR